jgi:RNA polymerase sigma-70 factor (ECF subfamily)
VLSNAGARSGNRLGRLVPVRANRQPAWGEYRRDPLTGVFHVAGLYVVGLAGDRICELIRFETTLAPYFGLPRTLDQLAGRLGEPAPG